MLHELIDIQAGAGSLRNSRSDMAAITRERSQYSLFGSADAFRIESLPFERYWRRHVEATVDRFFEPLDFWVWRDGV